MKTTECVSGLCHNQWEKWKKKKKLAPDSTLSCKVFTRKHFGISFCGFNTRHASKKRNCLPIQQANVEWFLKHVKFNANSRLVDKLLPSCIFQCDSCRSILVFCWFFNCYSIFVISSTRRVKSVNLSLSKTTADIGIMVRFKLSGFWEGVTQCPTKMSLHINSPKRVLPYDFCWT